MSLDLHRSASSQYLRDIIPAVLSFAPLIKSFWMIQNCEICMHPKENKNENGKLEENLDTTYLRGRFCALLQSKKLAGWRFASQLLPWSLNLRSNRHISNTSTETEMDGRELIIFHRYLLPFLYGRFVLGCQSCSLHLRHLPQWSPRIGNVLLLMHFLLSVKLCSFA